MATKKQIKTLYRWADALESGKYEQCGEKLCITTDYDEDLDEYVELSTPKYCCLGVLGKMKRSDNEGFLLDTDQFHKWTGLTRDFLAGKYPEAEDLEYFYENIQNLFVGWNDADGLSFKQIAKKVRSMAKQLEKENLKKQKNKT